MTKKKEPAVMHWHIIIQRNDEQYWTDKKIRTVGRYTIWHNGANVPGLHGWTAESKGPSDNKHARNRRRIEARTYPLYTQQGEHYKTINYNPKATTRYPRPGVLVGDTGRRDAILIHVGHGFLASVGCINLSGPLPDAYTEINFLESRTQVITMIEDMKSFLGDKFPKENGVLIPGSFLTIREISR